MKWSFLIIPCLGKNSITMTNKEIYKEIRGISVDDKKESFAAVINA